MNKLSYALGMLIGENVKSFGAENLSSTDFAKAVEAVFNGTATELEPLEAQQIVQTFLAEQEAKKGTEAKKAGEEFLKANSEKEGVMSTPSGLQYMIIEEGNGKSPKATDQVKCHYEGTLIDGQVFDSSYRRNEPATFPLNGVIKGWTEGLQLMKEGSKYRFFIPFDLAYGANGAGNAIPPYAALIFDVELLEIL